jgi:hypothetical protein
MRSKFHENPCCSSGNFYLFVAIRQTDGLTEKHLYTLMPHNGRLFFNYHPADYETFASFKGVGDEIEVLSFVRLRI